MSASQYEYRESELSHVDANGECPAKIKIESDDGYTKWLNITATEFEQIKAVLLDYRNNPEAPARFATPEARKEWLRSFPDS